MVAIVDSDLCVGCETCVDECPVEAIAMEDGIAVIDNDLCTDCGTCVDVCPAEAIQME
ncbi:MAG: 4Fe-4S binding protein [Methanofollis sp.]|nr:4Fe-4S binding protein [Methanofollis sp.]